MQKKGYFLEQVVWYAPVAVLLALMSCSAPEPGNVSFTGTWNVVNENHISGDSTESTSTVITDGNRFKIDGTYYNKVYDGTVLYSKPKPALYENRSYSYEPDPGMFETTQQDITPRQAKQMKFWLKPLGKKKGAGGSIAGRETILYEAAANRPDGQFSAQVWVDADTKIALKSIQTIYSRQIGQIVTRESTECQQVDFYSTIDDASFAKP